MSKRKKKHSCRSHSIVLVFLLHFHIPILCMQAYRLQQTIHDEISNQLKSIDKLRIIPTTDEMTNTKITEHKNKIAEMLKIHSHLKELLQNIHQISIESFVDLLTHKFNVILTESSVNELLNFDEVKLPSLGFRSENIELSKDDVSSVYLNDILRRCSDLKHEQLDEIDAADMVKVMTDEAVRDIVWPEVMDRLENFLDHRTKLKVDLKRLTTEEEAMVESIGNECVESIFDNLFPNNK